MNENPWLISGAIIGIVAGIAFAPLLAVPVAVALGVGGGTLATTAIGCGIIATGGATGALIGGNSSSNPNKERDAKQNEHVAPNDEETKALNTKSSTPANTQSQEPKVNASLWTKNKTLTSTPTGYELTFTNDKKSILQKLLKYQIEGVRKILEDEPEQILAKSKFKQVFKSPIREVLQSPTEEGNELKMGIKFEKDELSKTIPQRIKLDKIKNFFKEVTIVEEDGSYKIKTSKEVFDKILATDITEFSSKTKDFEQLKLLQKNFETFNLYTLELYKSEHVKSDLENFKRTGEAKKESDELTSKIHALKFINISYYSHLTSSTSLIPTETFVFNLTKSLNEFNQRTDESPNRKQKIKSTTSELNKSKENNSTVAETIITEKPPVVNWDNSRGQAHPTPSSSPIRDSKNVSVLPPSSLSDDLLGSRIDVIKNEEKATIDESKNAKEKASDNKDSTKLPLAPDAPLIPINKYNSRAEEVGPSALIKNPNSSSTTRSSLARRSTIRTKSQEKDSITDTPSPKTSKRVSFDEDIVHPTAPSGAPKPAPELLKRPADDYKNPENIFC